MTTIGELRIRGEKQITSWGVGPVTLDIESARRGGWSDEQIARATTELDAISRRENHIAHANGVVPGCPCCVCDLSTNIDSLPPEYWEQRHLVVAAERAKADALRAELVKGKS